VKREGLESQYADREGILTSIEDASTRARGDIPDEMDVLIPRLQ
jgi:hypothetical protein